MSPQGIWNIAIGDLGCWNLGFLMLQHVIWIFDEFWLRFIFFPMLLRLFGNVTTVDM
jgi:hypothetical protein